MRQPNHNSIIWSIGIVPALVFGCNKADQAPPPATTSSTTPSSASMPPASASPANTASVSNPAPITQQEAETPAQPEEPVKNASENAAPEGREELVAEMIKHYRNGMINLRKKQVDEAYQAFIEAGTLAATLKDRFPESTSMEQAVCAQVFYNQACALSKQDQPDKALAALQNAFDSGFDDFSQLDDDEDLESLRRRPEFAQQRAGWETRAYERAVVEVRHELQEFQTYPFDFALPDLDANDIKLADYKGKVVIVDIWGTWCPPCRREIPSFVKLQSEFDEQGLQIIGVNYEHAKDTEKKVALIREFAAETSINYPCLIGDDDTKKQVPDFQGFPTTLFIDRSGKVRLQFVGLHSHGKLKAVVEMLLAETET